MFSHTVQCLHILACVLKYNAYSYIVIVAHVLDIDFTYFLGVHPEYCVCYEHPNGYVHLLLAKQMYVMCV